VEVGVLLGTDWALWAKFGVTAVFIYSDTFLVVLLWHVILLASMRQAIRLAILHMSSSGYVIFLWIGVDPFIDATQITGFK
jgi:hypothetical protein